MLKRLSAILLAVVLVVVTTGQVMPCAMVMTVTDDAVLSTDASSAQPGTDMPCKGMAPTCMDSMGCAVVIGLPTAPVSAPTSFQWAEVLYPALVSALDGRSIEPELSPPILSA